MSMLRTGGSDSLSREECGEEAEAKVDGAEGEAEQTAAVEQPVESEVALSLLVGVMRLSIS
jgi:hypothetical protein